jgi:hypothetical protein
MKKILIIFLLLAGRAAAQSIPGGYCTISDTIYHGDGTRFAGARVIVSRVEKSGNMISLGPRTYTANASGFVSFTVPQGATCYIYANISGFNTPPSGAQVSIPDSSGANCTYAISSLQPASTTVSTNAGVVRVREVDGSPTYTISGNDDTLEVTNATLSNPSTNVFRITIPTALDSLSDVDISGATTSDILMRRSNGTWVDTSATSSLTSNNYTWTGTHTFNNFITTPNFLEYLGGALEATSSNGSTDTTAFYIPMELFSLSDTATIDFSTSARFASLDSIVILGGTISATGDSAALSVQIKQTVEGGSYTGAFNTAAIDSSDLGAGSVQVAWRFTSFGSLTTSVRSTLRAKIWRSSCTNDATADVFIERVLIYGVGLR